MNIDFNNAGRLIFECKAEKLNGIFVIMVQGSINALYSPILRNLINKAYKNQLGNVVVVDLTLVDYMDSSGIATLIEGVQLAEFHQKKFVLVGLVSTKIQHLLEITHLKDLFEHYKTIQDVIDLYDNKNSEE